MEKSFSAPDTERQIPMAIVSLGVATIHKFWLQRKGQVASSYRFLSFNLFIEAK